MHQIVPALLGPYRAGVAHVRSAIRLDARRAALRQRVGVDHSAAAATQGHVVRGNAGFDVDVWRAFGHDGGYRRADSPLQIGVTWLANLGAASYHITHYRYDDTNYAYATMVYRLA